MKRLSGMTGEVFNITAQRLVRYGCSESQAYALSRLIRLDHETPDATVEAAVIGALVAAKEAVDGVPEVEYISGQRRDTLRLDATRREGR
jgi:hypothetical protein